MHDGENKRAGNAPVEGKLEKKRHKTERKRERASIVAKATSK